MRERWHRRAGRRLRHSLKARLVAVFLLLAFALAGAFLFGMQKAVSIGWRDAARPIVNDYVDRLAAEIGQPPSTERARALAERLPVTVRIRGPQVNWESHPPAGDRRFGARGRWNDDEGWLTRSLADGHTLAFGLNVQAWRERPRIWAWATLAMLLLLTLVAYKFVRRLLRPLEDISAGAQRYGRGEFTQAIPVRRRDELGELAEDVNAMAGSIHQMLEAKRALLLAISHELRSPITRARLNVELLPDTGEAAARRDALLRDLQEMADLVTELLESERLNQGHAALQCEPTDLAACIRQFTTGLEVRLDLADGLPLVPVDRARIRMLVRNLLDNARRHGAATEPPVLQLRQEGQEVLLAVRDFGPGVDEAVLPRLADPFYRPDASRTRDSGGVGLGLYLCRLVAQAHGGRLELRNALPGLQARVLLPL